MFAPVIRLVFLDWYFVINPVLFHQVKVKICDAAGSVVYTSKFALQID